MGWSVVLAIEGRFQADVQGEVIDRATHLGVRYYPAAVEGRIASPEGPFGRIEHLHHRAIATNQGVVAHLIFIAGMGRHEGVDG